MTSEPSHEQSGNEATEAAIGEMATQQQIGKLEADLKEANERVLRGQAELENYRKRSRRELEDDRKYAALPLARDLLSVIDNLQRALDAAAKAESSGDLLVGVKMVLGQLTGILAQHQCVPIETVGQSFDPNFHQAIAQEPSTEHAAGVVTRAAQVGYKLHDRVIRPAQVFVSTGPAPSA